jgi:hypothetical protein
MPGDACTSGPSDVCRGGKKVADDVKPRDADESTESVEERVRDGRVGANVKGSTTGCSMSRSKIADGAFSNSSTGAADDEG